MIHHQKCVLVWCLSNSNPDCFGSVGRKQPRQGWSNSKQTTMDWESWLPMRSIWYCRIWFRLNRRDRGSCAIFCSPLGVAAATPWIIPARPIWKWQLPGFRWWDTANRLCAKSSWMTWCLRMMDSLTGMLGFSIPLQGHCWPSFVCGLHLCVSVYSVSAFNEDWLWNVITKGWWPLCYNVGAWSDLAWCPYPVGQAILVLAQVILRLCAITAERIWGADTAKPTGPRHWLIKND